jgi:hypothetical protein
VSFLAPWALVLAAAVAVPLILHLLHRRSAARVEFPALRYLERAQKERASEVRLRNLVLMLVRIGIVLALALAAARPLGLLPFGGHAPTAMVVLLDNSLSTGAAGREGPVFARLVAVAKDVVGAAGADDAVWIATLDGELLAMPSDDADAMRALDALRPLAGAGDPAGALARATAQLAASSQRARVVVVLTDGQASSWIRVDSAASSTPTLLHVVPSPSIANHAVTDIEAEPRAWAPRGAVRAQVQAPATDTSIAWRLVVEGRSLARGAQSGGGVVTARAEPRTRGWLAGLLELAPDELRGDDTRHFVVRVGDAPTVAVDAGVGTHVRGAFAVLEEGGRVRRGSSLFVGPATSARQDALLLAPTDPLQAANANRALERARIPWRFGARRTGASPLRGGGLDGATAFAWFTLQAEPGARADTLVRVGESPWAVAGDGYVLVASALEPNATDLPLRAGFLPWLDRLVHERLAASGGTVIASSPGAAFTVPAGASMLEHPDGSRRELRAGERIDAPRATGVYFFLRGGERAGALVVNAEAAESDLTPLAPDSLAVRLGGATVEPNAPLVARRAFAAAGARALDRTMLWLAFALLVLEQFLARRARTAAADKDPAP